MLEGYIWKGMGFISFLAQSEEDALFSSYRPRETGSALPRRKLLVMICLFSLPGALPSAQKWQDTSSEMAEREHPAALQRE